MHHFLPRTFNHVFLIRNWKGKNGIKITQNSLDWTKSIVDLVWLRYQIFTSSITSMEQSFKMHTPFFARSSILPGVPTSKWTGWYKRIISSFKLVPPVVTMTWIFRCFPSSLHTCDVWRANSRVGTSITTGKINKWLQWAHEKMRK